MFDPVRNIEQSTLILDADGSWPSFHDAEIHDVRLWRGDMRSEQDQWVGPTIEVTIELLALAHPFLAVLKFHDCDAIELADFNHQNAILSLDFAFEERGLLANGEPLTPYVRVTFKPAFGLHMTFRCFRIEVLERRKAEPIHT